MWCQPVWFTKWNEFWVNLQLSKCLHVDLEPASICEAVWEKAVR